MFSGFLWCRVSSFSGLAEACLWILWRRGWALLWSGHRALEAGKDAQHPRWSRVNTNPKKKPPPVVLYVAENAKLLFFFLSLRWAGVDSDPPRSPCVRNPPPPSRGERGAQMGQQREPLSPAVSSFWPGLWLLPGLPGAPGSVYECVLSLAWSPCLCFLMCLTLWLSPHSSDDCQQMFKTGLLLSLETNFLCHLQYIEIFKFHPLLLFFLHVLLYFL